MVIASILLALSDAHAQEAKASRISIHAGEATPIPFPAMTTVISLNEAVAEVVPNKAGFSLKGKAPGETMVQAFGEGTVAVFVVHVEAPLPGPPGPPSPVVLGERGPLQSLWGANSYSANVQRMSSGDWQSLHTLTLQGRVHGGEHLATTQFYLSNLGHQLQQATIGWNNDARTLGFEAGDTSGRVEGTAALGAIGLKGLSVRRLHALGPGRGEVGYEVFAGSLRSPADPTGLHLSQPVLGGVLHRVWNAKGGARLRLATSALGFESASSSLSIGQTGMVTGSTLRAFWDNGFSCEARGALSVVRPNTENARGTVASSIGAILMHGSNRGSARLEYEGNQRNFAQPQSTLGLPGSQRFAASAGRKIGDTTASASASYSRMTYAHGPAGNAYSFRLNASRALGPRDRLTLQAGQNNLVLPAATGRALSALRSFRNDLVGARLEHTVDGHPIELQAELNYLGTDTGDSASQGGMAGLSVQRRRQDQWEASGAVAVSAAQMRPKGDVLASDQPILNVGASASANARFIQGPFESFGGLGLNATAMPTVRLSPTVNIGVQFTPTSAHRLTGTMTAARYANDKTAWTVSAGYTHHFGNAVKARPVLEFLRVGSIEGRVCFDEDQDGECGDGEPSIPNVPVAISDGRTTLTDEHGRYVFDHVKPGFYSVEVDESSLRRQGRPTTVLSTSFELEPRAERRFSVGVARACRIRGHVVNDVNLDAIASDGEPLFGQGTVLLSGPGGSFQARIDPMGTFSATLPCGEYDVELDTASLPQLHSPGALVTPHVRATPEEIPSVVLLVRAIRTIAGEVFVDTNGNGQKDADETAAAGVSLRIGKSTARTDEAGSFLLRRVPAGEGTISVDESSLPPAYRPGPPRSVSVPTTPAAIEGVLIPILPR